MRVDLDYMRLLVHGRYRNIVVIASVSGGWLHTREYAIRRGVLFSGIGFARSLPL